MEAPGGPQFAEPVMGSEGDAWMGPVHEQMVPLNCPPGEYLYISGDVIRAEFRLGVSHHDRPAHHQAKEGDVGGRHRRLGCRVRDFKQIQNKERVGPGLR